MYSGIIGAKVLKALDKGKKKLENNHKVDLVELIEKGAASLSTHRDEDYKFHCSGLHTCSRMYYWNWLYGKPDNKKGEFSIQGKFAVLVGKKIHDLLEQIMEEAAKIGLASSFTPEVPLESPEHHLAGSCDGILQIGDEKFILEFKSTNMRMYEKFVEKPKHDHKTQLQMYLFMGKIDVGYVIYFNKDDADLTVHEVESNPAYQARVLERLAEIMDNVEKKVVPTNHLSCDDLTNLNKQCPNYLRCKNYQTKGQLPKETEGMTREKFLKMMANEPSE
jgi:hypothetical protein